MILKNKPETLITTKIASYVNMHKNRAHPY